MVDLQDKYHITSNRESGFGRYDIMLEPVEIGQSDAIILEFKVIDPESEADLNATVNSALEQIRHKQYDAQLLARGFRPDQIRCIWICFSGKAGADRKIKLFFVRLYKKRLPYKIYFVRM